VRAKDEAESNATEGGGKRSCGGLAAAVVVVVVVFVLMFVNGCLCFGVRFIVRHSVFF
jgi:hypothetical protein